MREILNYRKQHRKAALRALGISGDQVRGWTTQVEALGAEAAILALPFLGGSAALAEQDQPLQHPTTGEPAFMWGVSDFGGSDAHMA